MNEAEPCRTRQFDYGPSRPPVKTLESFLQDVDRIRAEGVDAPWYFRGDANSADEPSDLRPHIGRHRDFAGKSVSLLKDETVLLNRFKRFAYQEFNREATDWEALFLARHYNLPTRIMDWSTSPLVELYFSCSAKNKAVTPGVVWGIRRQPNLVDSIDVFERDDSRGPLKRYGKTPAIKLVYPIYNSGRIIAQKGLFTWHCLPDVPMDLAGRTFRDDHLDISQLVKWPIEFSDNSERVEMLRKLEQLGFSSRTIVPDLEGIAAGLWQTRVLFS